MPHQDPQFIFATIVVLVLAITVHEYCHAVFADMAGNPTPRMQGRVTLNPLAHLDPMGSILMVMTVINGFGIGWGKPVMVQPNKMRNPRWDHFISVIAGPLSNLLQATLFAMVLRFGFGSKLDPTSFLALFLFLGVLVNIGLFLFNLIPIGPLDGHWLVGAFLPDPLRYRWYVWNRSVGTLVLFGVLIVGWIAPQYSLISAVLRPGAEYFERLLLGDRLFVGP